MAIRKPAKKQAPAPKKTPKLAAPKKATGAPALKKAAPPAKPKKAARPARPAAPAPAAEPAQPGLTDLQQCFVDEYLVNLNGTQAAIRAGYSPDTARHMASENLSKPYIQVAIADARKLQQARTHINADRVVVEAWNIVFANQRCGMIAQDRETAEAIFRDKVVFAYDHLPEELRERFPLAEASTKELLFGHNNSSIRVATSVRGGTIHRLHVSDFGKICAKFPAKANEVVTGSIPAVPLSGILVIESTAEGWEGEFYDMCQRAQALVAGKAKLTASQYRFHSYAWWQDPAYSMDTASIDAQ